VFLETFMIPQLKNFLTFVEPLGSLAWTLTEPVESSPHSHTLVLEGPLLYYLSTYVHVFQVAHSLLGTQN